MYDTAQKIIALLAFCLFTFWIAHTANAQTPPEELRKTRMQYRYEFYLLYKNGTLAIDQNAENSYRVENLPYATPRPTTSATLYKGEVINFLDKIGATFTFDPQQNVGPDDKIIIQGPHVADAKEVRIYDPVGEQIITLSVADTSFCNDNSVCEEDFGEYPDTCPYDCKASPVVSQPIRPGGPISTSNFQEESSPDTSIGLGYKVGVGILILFGIIALIYIWEKLRKSSYEE